MKENVVQTKSYAFAVRIVRLYQHLAKRKRNMSCRSRSCGVGQVLGQTSRRRSAVNHGRTFSPSCPSPTKKPVRRPIGYDFSRSRITSPTLNSRASTPMQKNSAGSSVQSRNPQKIILPPIRNS